MIQQRGTLGTDNIGGRSSDLPEQPNPEGPIGGERGTQEGPISERVGRNPGNLGDDVAGAGDTVYPAPDAGSADDVGPSEM